MDAQHVRVGMICQLRKTPLQEVSTRMAFRHSCIETCLTGFGGHDYRQQHRSHSPGYHNGGSYHGNHSYSEGGGGSSSGSSDWWN